MPMLFYRTFPHGHPFPPFSNSHSLVLSSLMDKTSVKPSPCFVVCLNSNSLTHRVKKKYGFWNFLEGYSDPKHKPEWPRAQVP